MGMIGSFGEVVFEVSSEKVRTFDNFSRSGSGRWVNHDIISLKPMPEFIGPGQEEISFLVRLDTALGVDPRSELQKLRNMRDAGEVSVLIIGGEPITNNLWALESISEKHKTFSGSGYLIKADAELVLKEYLVLSTHGWKV